MIMPRGQQLLLPVNPLFIWGSIVAALLLNMLQHTSLWPHAAWAPDLLALVLMFWCVHQPRRVGIGVAFAFGLLTDVHLAALLGQHALAYTVMAYVAAVMHRRLLWFSVPKQALQIAPVFVLMHGTDLAVRLIAGGAFPGWSLVLAPVLESLLWPVVNVLLLAPQRRAPDRDAHRPL